MTGIEIAAIAATAVSALGAIQQGSSQRAIANANAAAQQRQAALDFASGEAEASRVQDQGRRRRASALNQLAGSGIDEQSGSASDLMSDLAAGSALDAAIARWRGSVGAQSREQQAAFTRAEGQQAQQAAWWRAGSTLLTGGSRLMALRGE